MHIPNKILNLFTPHIKTNSLKWIHWVDDVGCEKVAVIKLALAIVEKTQTKENRWNTYILIKKYNKYFISTKKNFNFEDPLSTKIKATKRTLDEPWVGYSDLQS